MAFGDYEKKGRRYPVEILTSEEVRAMMAGCSRRGACGARDRALIATLYRGALRIAEALALMPKDVDVATGAVHVLNGKGGKQRTVAVDAETIALIEIWMARRAAIGLNGRQPLFCTFEGGAIRREQVSKRLKALAVKAGIEKRVHPHGLRHSRSVDLLHGGVDVKTIQLALGHASLATTDTYLTHIAAETVTIAMKGGSW